MMTRAEQIAFREGDDELQSWRDALDAKRVTLFARQDLPKFVFDKRSDGKDAFTYKPGHGNSLKNGMSEPVKVTTRTHLDADTVVGLSAITEFNNVRGFIAQKRGAASAK
jgi:hypothetical protein